MMRHLLKNVSLINSFSKFMHPFVCVFLVNLQTKTCQQLQTLTNCFERNCALPHHGVLIHMKQVFVKYVASFFCLSAIPKDL